MGSEGFRIGVAVEVMGVIASKLCIFVKQGEKKTLFIVIFGSLGNLVILNW